MFRRGASREHAVIESVPTFTALSRTYWLMSCLGALVFGVVLPCFLVFLNAMNTPQMKQLGDEFNLTNHLPPVVMLFFWGLLIAGPGIVVIALFLHRFFKASCALQPDLAPGKLLFDGMLTGASTGILNFPAWFAAAMFDWNNSAVLLKFLLLFVVPGATYGAWIAWQAYRSHHPGEGLIPRYTLGSLLMAVFGWGILLAIYAPAR